MWLLVVEVCAALSFLAIVLLGHLLGFHLFLAFKGLSTYDYIVRKRNSSFHGAATDGTKRFFLKWCKPKANQVSPVQHHSKDTAVRKNNVLQLNGRVDSENGSQKDEQTNASCPGDVHINRPSHQHHILMEMPKPRFKTDRRTKGSKALEVSEHGSHAVVGITQPGRESSQGHHLDRVRL